MAEIEKIQFIIPIKSEEIKQEILESFAANFANNEGLEPEDLAIKHISNFIRSQLNEKREKLVVEVAKSAFVREANIFPEAAADEIIVDDVPVKKVNKSK